MGFKYSFITEKLLIIIIIIIIIIMVRGIATAIKFILKEVHHQGLIDLLFIGFIESIRAMMKLRIGLC